MIKNMTQLFTVYFFKNEYVYMEKIFNKIVLIESTYKKIAFFNAFYKYWKDLNIAENFKEYNIKEVKNKKIYGWIYDNIKVSIVEQTENFLKKQGFSRKEILFTVFRHYILMEHNILIEKPIIFGKTYEEFLIKNTNLEERESYIKKLENLLFDENLYFPYKEKFEELSQKYILGEKELNDVTMEFYNITK